MLGFHLDTQRNYWICANHVGLEHDDDGGGGKDADDDIPVRPNEGEGDEPDETEAEAEPEAEPDVAAAEEEARQEISDDQELREVELAQQPRATGEVERTMTDDEYADAMDAAIEDDVQGYGECDDEAGVDVLSHALKNGLDRGIAKSNAKDEIYIVEVMMQKIKDRFETGR